MELFFDSTIDDKVNVVNAVDDLFRCCVPCKEAIKGQKPMPFLVKFKWGYVTSFPAFVTQVQAKYTRFDQRNPDPGGVHGEPGGAGYHRQSQNPTSGTMSADRVHTMVTGDTLALLAYQEYGDPALWRPLADYNRVDDPMRITDGARLLLPRRLLEPVG